MLPRIVLFGMLFVAILNTGCGKGPNPLVPGEISRFAMDFNPPQNLFTYNGNKLAWHVDLASVVVGPNPPPGIYTPGDVWNRSNYVGDIWNYCAGVSIVDYNLADGLVGDVYSNWLASDHSNPTIHSTLSAEHDVTGLSPCSERMKFPRCDAMYFYSTVSPEDSVIELAVCYMIQGPGGSLQWDIGVSINTWQDTYLTFPWAEPDRVDYRWQLPDNDESQPDISYDPYTGDIYLVYTVETVPARVYYRRYDRETTTWSDQYPVHSSEHGGWIPRIDVGLMESIPSVVGEEDVVGVAYSAFGQGGHNHFHPSVTYWPTSESDGEKGSLAISVCNPAFGTTLHSGLPDICIGPNSNAEHIAGLVYVQESTGASEYCIYEIDSKLKNWCKLNVPDEDPIPNRFLPSISIHYQDSGDPVEASISSFFQQPGALNYPAYEEVWRIDMSLPLNDPLKLTNHDRLYNAARGTWDPMDLFGDGGNKRGINPGLSSSIVVREDHGYWAGFCDRVEWIVPWGNGVPKVAFGRTNG